MKRYPVRVITTHIRPDFDSVASLLAVLKLYPDAAVVLPGPPEAVVSDFLKEYPGILLLRDIDDIDPAKIRKIILVDISSRSRLGAARALLRDKGQKLHIYDHHERKKNSLKAELDIYSPTGANTTLLVGELKERGYEISPEEATLMALGIYEDTGSLTFPSTTRADLEAVSFLLSCGADLTVVSRYVHPELKPEQISILEMMVHNIKRHIINGTAIHVTSIDAGGYSDDLAFVVHKLRDVGDYRLLFVLIGRPGKVHIIARSRHPQINIGRLMQIMGGGGHSTAASATLDNTCLVGAERMLLSVLRKDILPCFKTSEVMFVPVRTILSSESVEEAGKVMLRLSVKALPVTDRQGKLKGLITMKDVEKIRRHDMGRHPVREYMTRKVITARPDDPISEIQQGMMKNNISHVPVLKRDRIVGMVTDNGIIQACRQGGVHEPDTLFDHSRLRKYDISNLVRMRLSKKIISLLEDLGRIAADMGLRSYIVGGLPRDIIIGKVNLDIDIVVEGDAISFADSVSKLLGARALLHPKFRTASLVFSDGLKVDVATSRTEFYQFPAALPDVRSGPLKQDLYRRDFTINTLAMSLHPGDFGIMMDFFGGIKDIKEKRIRILYNLSFIEDPTRILRAARFSRRFNFSIDAGTMSFLKTAVRRRLIRKLSPDRLREEFLLVFAEKEPVSILSFMNDLGILACVDPVLRLDKGLARIMRHVSGKLVFLRKFRELVQADTGLVFLIILTERSGLKGVTRLDKRLRFSRYYREVLMAAARGLRKTEKLLSMKKISAGLLCREISSLSAEAIAALFIRARAPVVRNRVIRYFRKLCDIKPSITGGDLKAMGIPPGPVFSRILEKIREEKLAGRLSTKEQEKAFVVDNFFKR